MSEREWESEVIGIDNDITTPGASKQTNRTVTDRLMNAAQKDTNHTREAAVGTVLCVSVPYC